MSKGAKKSSEGLSQLRFECTECGECCTNRGEYHYVYVDDAEVRGIAELLGIAEGTAKAHLHHARKQLRKDLGR